MDWVNLSPTSLTVTGLSGTTPPEIVRSLLEKITAETLENIQVTAEDLYPIFRLDGNWYEVSPFLVRFLTPAPGKLGAPPLDDV